MRLGRPAGPPDASCTLPGLSTIAVLPGRIVAGTADRVVLLNEWLERIGEIDHLFDVWHHAAPDGLYWVDDLRIHRCDWSGRVAELARIPMEAVGDELRRLYPHLVWHGTGGTTRHVADEQKLMRWAVTADADDRFLFACNRMPGFTVVCFSRTGELLWFRCLSPGCCGYRVQRLSSGLFTASSGCGGTVSWFDERGDVIAQSAPLLAKGLEGLIASDLMIAEDDSVYVQRLRGDLLAFDSAGRPLWELSVPGAHRACLDRAGNRLLCAREIPRTGRFRLARTRIEAWTLPHNS